MPHFTNDLKKARKPINARSETIAKSGMFRAAFAQRRCLVPAPAYYEWHDDPDNKTPFAVARVDDDPVAFGGIWEMWKSSDGEILQTFATITTDANRQLSAIQDRMPVIIERKDWPLWLGEIEGDPGQLLRPLPEDVCKRMAYRESRRQRQERRAGAARTNDSGGTDTALTTKSCAGGTGCPRRTITGTNEVPMGRYYHSGALQLAARISFLWDGLEGQLG